MGSIKHFHRVAVLIRRVGQWACGVYSNPAGGFEAYESVIALSQATHFLHMYAKCKNVTRCLLEQKLKEHSGL